MMRTSHFSRELLPPARTFYEREFGGKLSRPRRGWAMGRCPFHQSKSGKSFSVNIETGGFCCFGCGVKGGDVLAFLRQRDGLSFKEAAQRLGAWDEAPSAETVLKLAAQARERDRQVEADRQTEERRRRIQLRNEVHTAARLQREASERLTELCRGATPTSDGEEEACWAVMALALDDLRECEAEYCAAAGVEYNA
jgi:hypothetical protein